MFSTISAWRIGLSLSLILLNSIAEEVNPHNPLTGRDLAPPFIFLPDDEFSNGLIAANTWTADESGNGQLSQLPDYSINGHGLGQLTVGESDRCQPKSNQNQRRIRRGQLCPAPAMKATGQDTSQETGQETGQNRGTWPSERYPDDLPAVTVPDRPSVKADMGKCDHNKYNTPVCDPGEDSSPDLNSPTSEWTLPNCVPLMPWYKDCAGTEVIWCCQIVESRPPMPSDPGDLNLVHKHSCYRCIRQALLPKKPDLPPPLGESNVLDRNF